MNLCFRLVVCVDYDMEKVKGSSKTKGRDTQDVRVYMEPRMCVLIVWTPMPSNFCFILMII